MFAISDWAKPAQKEGAEMPDLLCRYDAGWSGRKLLCDEVVIGEMSK